MMKQGGRITLAEDQRDELEHCMRAQMLDVGMSDVHALQLLVT